MLDYHFDQNDVLNTLKRQCVMSAFQDPDKRYWLLQAPPSYGKSHLLRYFILAFPKVRMEGQPLPKDQYSKLKRFLEEEERVFKSADALKAALFQTTPLDRLRSKLKNFCSVKEGVEYTLDLLVRTRFHKRSGLLYFLENLKEQHEGEDRADEIQDMIDTLFPYLEDVDKHSFLNIEHPGERGEVWRMFYVDLSSSLPYEDIASKILSQPDGISLLLCFDTVEFLEASAQRREWLKGLLGEIEHRAEGEKLIVRVVLAGRRVHFFWDEYQQFMRLRGVFVKKSPPLSLKPFTKEALKDRALELRPDAETLDKKVELLYHYSGGYPGVVSEMLRDVNLSARLGEFERCLDEVVSEFAEKFFDNVFEDVGMNAKQLKALGIFRVWSMDVLSELRKRGLLDRPPIELFGEFKNKKFIRNPAIGRLPRPNIPRRIIVRYLQLHDPEMFNELNQIACTFYEQRIDDNTSRVDKRLLAVIEWLYHTLNLSDLPLSPQDLALRVKEYISRISSDRQAVAETIEKMREEENSEIVFLFERRYGPEGWALFEKEVFHGDL